MKSTIIYQTNTHTVGKNVEDMGDMAVMGDMVIMERKKTMDMITEVNHVVDMERKKNMDTIMVVNLVVATVIRKKIKLDTVDMIMVVSLVVGMEEIAVAMVAMGKKRIGIFIDEKSVFLYFCFFLIFHKNH